MYVCSIVGFPKDDDAQAEGCTLWVEEIFPFNWPVWSQSRTAAVYRGIITRNYSRNHNNEYLSLLLAQEYNNTAANTQWRNAHFSGLLRKFG